MRRVAFATIGIFCFWILSGYVKVPPVANQSSVLDGIKKTFPSASEYLSTAVAITSSAEESRAFEPTLKDRPEPVESRASEPTLEQSTVHQSSHEGQDDPCKNVPWTTKGSSLSMEEKAKLCRQLFAFVLFDYGASSPRIFQDRMELIRHDKLPLCGISVAIFNVHQGYCDGYGQLQSFLFSSKYKELNCMLTEKVHKIVVPETGLTLIDGDYYLKNRKPLPKYDVTIACVRLTPEIMSAAAASAKASVPIVLRDMMSDSVRDRELLKSAISVGTFITDAVLTKGLVSVAFDAFKQPDPPKPDDKSVAPVLYISSHCGVPFRDNFVKEFMKHIKVDSVGKCMNNKQQVSNKQGRYDNQTDAFARQYKFMIAAENTDCSSYCSEKVWMPLARGVVPIVHGCSAIKSFVPKNSIIYSRDFASVAELAKHVKRLSEDPAEYAKLLAWRKTGQSNLVAGDEWQQRFATETWGVGGGYALYRMLREGVYREEVFGGLVQAVSYVSPYVDLSKAVLSRGKRPFLSECRTENPNAARYFTKTCRTRNRDLPSLPPWTQDYESKLKCHRQN